MRTRPEGQGSLQRSTWRGWRHRSGLVWPSLALSQNVLSPLGFCSVDFGKTSQRYVLPLNRLSWQNDVSLDLLDRGTLYDVYCALAAPSGIRDVCCEGLCLEEGTRAAFPLNPGLSMPVPRVGWSRDEAVQYSCYAQALLSPLPCSKMDAGGA